MSIYDNVKQGVDAIKRGNKGEGERLLRYVLQKPELGGKLRAQACNWLAVAVDDPDEKFRCYQNALQADPGNKHASEQLNRLIPPPEEPPIPDPQPAQPNQGGQWDLPPLNADDLVNDSSRNYSQGTSQYNVPFSPQAGPSNPQAGPIPGAYNNSPANPYQQAAGVQPTIPMQGQGMQPANSSGAFHRTVTIVGGPNGLGTGFFVLQNGLVATTRFVVSAMEAVVVELEPGRRVEGRVVRAFPELDLTFIDTGVRVPQLLTPTSQSYIPDNMPLTALNHDGRVMSGQRRATQADIRPDWFPTTISQALDAGGNPVFDDRNYLVGMLTRNANRTSSYLFGLHIAAIYRCVERYMQEVNSGVQRVFCPTCGYLSQAQNAGGFYCEMCGGVLPHARDMDRYPLTQPQLESIFGETNNRPCRFCGARAGYSDNRCLRCGRDYRTQDGSPLQS